MTVVEILLAGPNRTMLTPRIQLHRIRAEIVRNRSEQHGQTTPTLETIEEALIAGDPRGVQ
jgi:hypothetical protein